MGINRILFGMMALVGAGSVALPLFAQSTQPAAPTAAHAAADAQEVPQTKALNNVVANNITNTQVDNAVAQGQYEADRAAYLRAMRAHNHAVNASDGIFVRQQTAYADAMADWRVQVEACKRGKQRICNLPTPDPMNYM